MPKIKAVVLFLDQSLPEEELDEAVAQIRGHAHPAVASTEVRYNTNKPWHKVWSGEEVMQSFTERG